MEATQSRARSRADVVLVCSFLAALFLPLAENWLGFVPAPVIAEKRVLAALPELPRDRATLREFPHAFESYFNDHFGLRANLIRAHHLLVARAFGVAPSTDLVIGSEGWLYYNMQGALDLYRATTLLTPDELEVWRRHFEECRDWLADRDIPYLVVIAPEKPSVQPEHLPPTVRRIGATTRLDQLVAYLAAHSDVELLDLRPALGQARSEGDVYAATDTHWNDHGAFVAYRAILGRLKERWFPDVKLFERQDFERSEQLGPGGDLAGLMGLEDVFTERAERWRPGPTVSALDLRRETEGLLPITGLTASETRGKVPFAWVQDDARLKKLFLFHDSFALNLSYLLALQFRRSAFYWQYYFDPALVAHEQPDVVVHEFAERALMKSGPVPNPPELKRDFELRREFQRSRDVRLRIDEQYLFDENFLLITPEVRQPGERLLLRIDLDVPTATEFELATEVRALAPGRQVLYKENEGIGTFRLSGKGAWMRSIEVRAAPRASSATKE